MQQPAERVLIYDRIGANRRDTRLLLVLFALGALPVVAYLSPYLMLWAGIVLATLSAGVGAGDVFAKENLDVALVLMGVIVVLTLVALAVLQYRLASTVLLRLAGARLAAEDREPALTRMVENLCIGAGLPRPAVYVIEDTGANAFATGIDPAHAAVAVTRGALSLLDRRELEGVLAHELAVIGNHDVRLSTILAAGTGMLRLPFVILVAAIRFPFRIHRILGIGLLLYLGVPAVLGIPLSVSIAIDTMEEDALAGVLMLSTAAAALYAFLGAPVVAHVIRAAILRRRGFLADSEAVLLTRHPEALATALAKMDAAGSALTHAGMATAHLYAVDPLPADAPWWDGAFRSHPAVEERVALLSGMAGGTPASVLEKALAEVTASRGIGPVTGAAPAHADETAPVPPGGADERQVPQGQIAYRLTARTTLAYERPSAASPVLGELAAGSMITVWETEGDFLHVIMPDDRFCFIMRTAKMTPLDMPGPPDG